MNKTIVVALAGIVFAVVSCGENDHSSSKSDPSIPGEEIYTGNCTSCHGYDGKAGLMGSKDLTKSTMDENEMKSIIKNGKGVMTPFGTLLNDEEIAAVAKYVNSLK